MANLPDIKTITDLLKKGLTLEAQEQIMALREAAVDLKAENTDLKEQLAEMKTKADLRDKLIWHPPYYLLSRTENETDGPYCQHCWDKFKELIRLQKICKGKWECLSCKNDVLGDDYEPPRPMIQAVRRCRTPLYDGL